MRMQRTAERSALASPSSARARAVQAPVRAPPLPLLSDITVEHGPVDLLGRFFLKADTAARQRGVTLSFAPMQELVEVNERNRDTWRPLLPLFDPACGGITPDNSLLHARPQRAGRGGGDAGRAALRLAGHDASTRRPRACACSMPIPGAPSGQARRSR